MHNIDFNLQHIYRLGHTSFVGIRDNDYYTNAITRFIASFDSTRAANFNNNNDNNFTVIKQLRYIFIVIVII